MCLRKCAPEARGMCQACVETLTKPTRIQPLCTLCGRPLATPETCPQANAAAARTGPLLCAECLARPRSFHRVYPASLYKEPVRSLIHQLKYGARPGLSAPLARLMAAALNGRHFDYLIPVPMHPERLSLRQYNQALLLAQELALATGSRAHNALTKVAQPTSQSLLSRSERLAGLYGVFRGDGKAARLLRGEKVLLVDDVFTTGSTAHHCSLALLEIGVQEVHVSVVSASI